MNLENRRLRIDDSYQSRIAAIQQSTHTTLDEIIKQAIDLLYEKTALTPKEKNKKLIEMLAGSAEGPDDLSENYKDYLYQWMLRNLCDSFQST